MGHDGEKPSSCRARVPLYNDGSLPILCIFGRIPPMRPKAIINIVVVYNHLNPYSPLEDAYAPTVAQHALQPPVTPLYGKGR